LTYADIEARVHDERFRALMAHLATIARSHYDAAWPKLALLSSTGRLVAGAGAVYYRALLDELERGGFDVFHRRLRFSTARKLWIVFSCWPAIARPGTPIVS
jgi:phytoene synthase